MSPGVGRLFILILIAVPLMAVFHSALIEPLAPWAPNINIVLPLVIAIATVHPTPLGVCAAFFAGLLSDVGIALVLGPQAGSAVIVWLLIAMISNRVFVESKVTLLVLAVLASTAFSLSRLAFTLQFIPAATQSFSSILGEAFFSAILAIMLTPVLRQFLSPRGPDSQRDFSMRRRSAL